MARRETPREMPDMTPAQRRANWWHYHWHHVLLGGIILAILGGILLDQARERKPDCCVALVTRREADSQTLSSLQAALERIAPDANGDGEVHVDVYSIQIDYTSQDLSPEALRVMEANVDKLNFDFYTRRSGIFLLDDPENFQRSHQALAYLDGSTPPEGSADWENMTVPWADWPGSESAALAGGPLWFARRIVTGPKDEAALAGGALAGPGLCGLADTVLRGLRDEPGLWWLVYRRAWRRNARASLLPGGLGGMLLGTQGFLLANAGALRLGGVTMAALAAGILLVLALSLYLWPQLALMDLSLPQLVKNSALLFLGRFPRSLAALAILAGYLWLVLRYLPVALPFLPLTSLWLPALPALFLIYPNINETFHIEEKLGGN